MVRMGEARRVRVALGGALAMFVACGSALLAGCGSGSDDDPGTSAPEARAAGGPAASDGPGSPSAPSAEQLRERPWEIVSSKGETYLANVFYADASQNEQIMPWRIDGRAVIDRLVYPTLGNPNLYVKSDASDELVMVLRIEPDAYAHLAPRTAAADGDKPTEVMLTEDDANRFAFFLVAKSARATGEAAKAAAPGAGVLAITPKKILANAEPADMPKALATRHTLRFVFDRDAMKDVPPGLYDARFEVKKGGQIYANVYEWQYNAVRVFDRDADEYTALNVTDTQVSVGAAFHSLTADHLDDFVDAVNASADPNVKSAAFITFNGDLHNGGSPESILERTVATTYNQEAKRVIGALKRLDLPIFLTPGNHDGYVSTGQVPSGIKAIDAKLGVDLKKVIDEQNNLALPDYSWDAFSAFLAKTAGQPDGLARDLVGGGFTRKPGDTFAASFVEVPRADRNFVLYDGFYQWQKSYGPLRSSWTFGKNRFVSMNTFELRQHRRTGWGMYTVNYGGAVSQEQLAWLDREIGRARAASEDLTLLMHHDPRGGHKGVDFGYYFPMLRYQSMQQSLINYLLGEVFAPKICSNPDASLSVDDRESCLHDGLQEWMGPDEAFERQGSAYWMSGVDLLDRVAKAPEIRTLLIGHAHLNSLEVLQHGDVLVPNKVALDAKSGERIAAFEAASPVRRLAWERVVAPGSPAIGAAPLDAPSPLLAQSRFDEERARVDAMLGLATQGMTRTLDAAPSGARELAIIRLTSNADLTGQTYGSQKMFGWSVLHVNGQAGGTPRINRVTFLIHDGTAFDQVRTIDVDRTKSLAARGPENPVDQLFDW